MPMRRLLIMLMLAAVLGTAVDTTARRRHRSSSEVRRERQQNSRRIAEASRQLEQNTAGVRRQFNELQSLEARIARRADSIAVLQQRIGLINDSITQVADSIEHLEATLATLNSRLGATLRNMRSRRQGMSDLAFIFSAESFGQAWSRLRYLNTLSRATVRRAQQIKDMRVRLDVARTRLGALGDSLSTRMTALQQAQQALEAQRASASALVESLQRRGRELNAELERRRRQATELEAELQRAIDRELEEERQRREAEERRQREEEERRRREAAQAAAAAAATPAPASPATPASPANPPAPVAPTTTPAPSQTPQTAQVTRLTGSFADNKGKLPFPVSGNYTVVSQFGTNTHPGLSKVKVDNLGIDIEVTPGSSARAVFDGVVSSIFRIDGYHNVVIVRHGEYLTVYAGLEQLNVRKGSTVKQGQAIGVVFGDSADGNRSVLHFEIRHEKDKLNPAEWVR